MSHKLYQLYEHQFERLPFGYVQLDNQPDKYGAILKYQPESNTYLIRGIGNNKPSEWSNK